MGYINVKRFTPRFVRADDMAELTNLYHLANVPLAGLATRYKRLLWASSEFHKKHPEISNTAAYKDLDASLAFSFR